MKVPIRNSSLRIAGIYALVASLWIVLSDSALTFVARDFSRLATYQTFKGIFFVAATSVLLFLYSRSQLFKVVSLQSRQRQDAIDALKEKEVLLREVHHRVKNNLQVIVSLLGLKDGAEACAEDVRDKVRSMALVHELLYASPDLAAIDAAAFAAGLAELMRGSSAGSGTEIHGKGDSFPMSASTAIPLGIFLVEACSNSIQHGYSGLLGQDVLLRIYLSIHLESSTIVASVKDTGKGFGSQALEGSISTVGLPAGGSGTALMEAVASQVGGSILRSDHGGALIQLRCPFDS